MLVASGGRLEGQMQGRVECPWMGAEPCQGCPECLCPLESFAGQVPGKSWLEDLVGTGTASW